MGYLLLLLTEWGVEMMKSMITVAAMLVVLMALLGCGSSVQVAPPPERTVSDNNNIECAVFFDGSMSMQGFVNFPVATEYVDAINNIEQTLTVGWKNENITYYRFGDKVQKIDARERLSFARTDFYGDLLTQLDKIVLATNTRNLNIIVSDFLQTDQDFQKLVTAIKADYLRNGRGAALIGVKSRFKGYVYDVGLNKEQFYITAARSRKTSGLFICWCWANSALWKDFAGTMNRRWPIILTVELFAGQMIWAQEGWKLSRWTIKN